ncbi:hypothetical protein CRUP_025346 [Coryphaenoides rupestris]|nr:hypothetical protein CRUP_025346 [Coryphaenoides rupestris]
MVHQDYNRPYRSVLGEQGQLVGEPQHGVFIASQLQRPQQEAPAQDHVVAGCVHILRDADTTIITCIYTLSTDGRELLRREESGEVEAFRLDSLIGSTSPLSSLLNNSLPVVSTSSNAVLVPARRSSEGLLEVLVLRPEFSLFRAALIQHNLTDQIEQAGEYTVFAPTDSADVNATRYHVVLGRRLLLGALQLGGYEDTMLGFSYQLALLPQDGAPTSQAQVPSPRGRRCSGRSYTDTLTEIGAHRALSEPFMKDSHAVPVKLDLTGADAQAVNTVGGRCRDRKQGAPPPAPPRRTRLAALESCKDSRVKALESRKDS